jgi:glycosyltransferase involved in cell wall biosynthesis
MRIAIDYTAAIAQGAGIGRYTRSLVSALARVDAEDRFTLYSSEAATPERGFPAANNMRPRVFNIGNRYMTILWHRLHLPLPAELLMGRADVLHGPDFTLPPVLNTRRVVTIHDLAFLTNPECALPSLVAYLSDVVPRAVRAADHVIAVSQRSADDLVERLAVPREKISVIYLGVDPTLGPEREEAVLAAIRAKYALADPFVLAVGTIEPRKNYERLIAAFAQALRQPDGPRMLVVAGRKGWLYDGVFEAVARHGVADSVRFLDYVPDGDLRPLYQAASVLAMPSIYEGFGIPVVEAMACGTPVVCGTGGSLPEIAGDAALLVDPEDVTGLGAALVRAVSDSDLRSSLVARGLARTRLFSWDEAARSHVRIYHQVGGRA